MLPPGPNQSPLVTTWQWVRAPYDFLEKTKARFGETFTMRLLALPELVVVSDPEAVRTVFADDGETLLGGRFNLTLSALLGERSVLMADGASHIRKRKLLMPPFHGERMQAYGDVMIDAADRAIDAWEFGAPFRVHDHLQRITLHVILRTIFGVEDGPRLDAFAENIRELLELASSPRLLIPAMRKDLGVNLWGRYLRKRAALDAMLDGEIRSRRERGSAGRTDVLSMLVDARDEDGRPMEDVELRDELVTLLVAGHETTATGIAWLLHGVLANPEIEGRLRAELSKAEREGPLTPERIMKLEYLDATVREALRFVPVVPLVGRILDKPARIQGWDLPAGVAVSCSIYLAQRREAVYAHPDRFDPAHFLGKKIAPQEYFPFGGGVRRCIGMAFALYEMKIVTARIFTRATLRLADKRPMRPVRRSITLTPRNGLEVELVMKRSVR
ncbi:MAG: cytochrome P450 [Polyangiaceae bacterium]